MSELAAVLLSLAGILLLVPALVLCAEVVAAALPRPGGTTAPALPRPRVAVLVPARDEAPRIEAQVAALVRELTPGDRLIVIADHCRDDTAALARRAGALVLVRGGEDPAGKGFALAAGVERLRADPPEVVIVIDADTAPRSGLVATLAPLAAAGRPVQAAYTLAPPRDAWLGAKLSAFAFRLRNGVRPRGLARCGLPVLLQGSGMAFPWTLLRDARLAHARTAEDLELTLELALAGARVSFCDAAAVEGSLPDQPADALVQRRRWEHGHLALLLARAPRLLATALARRDLALAALALELAVPPLSLWALLWLAAAVPAFAFAAFGGSRAPVTLLVLAAALLTGALALAWLRFGRDLLPAHAWLELPRYFVAKLPVHAGFLRRRQNRWPAAGGRR